MAAVGTRGGSAKHPPYHGADHTSPWFALQYVKNHVPDIAPHDLVQLVASIGQETRGHYNYVSVANATSAYQQDKSFPTFQKGSATATSGGTPWAGRVGQVIRAAKSHGHKAWVTGFGYTSKDVPGSGGPSNLQKAAIGTSHGLSDVGNALGSAAGGLGGLISSPILILVILVVVVIVIKK